MTAPRIWKNKCTERGQQHRTKPGPCHLQGDKPHSNGLPVPASLSQDKEPVWSVKIKMGSHHSTASTSPCGLPSPWPHSGPPRATHPLPPAPRPLLSSQSLPLIAVCPFWPCWSPCYSSYSPGTPGPQECWAGSCPCLEWPLPSYLHGSLIISGRPSLASW